MKPVCVDCQLFYQPEKNGFPFEEGMQGDGEWQSYKLWLGDKWKCRGCGSEIIVGTGANPVSHHFMPDYGEMVNLLQPAFRVDDC